MKKFRTLRKDLGEAIQFRVNVEGLPPTFMTGTSPGEILQKLRKIVKQPSMIKSVERQTDADVRKAYRNKSQGKDIDEACCNDCDTDQWYKDQPEWGTKAAAKKAKDSTPGQTKEGTAQIRMNRALKKHGVGKNDEFYKSKMSPEARKKLEPKKRPEPAQVTKPKGKTFKWFATRDMKNG